MKKVLIGLGVSVLIVAFIIFVVWLCKTVVDINFEQWKECVDYLNKGDLVPKCLNG